MSFFPIRLTFLSQTPSDVATHSIHTSRCSSRITQDSRVRSATRRQRVLAGCRE
jgi:hypothetical protein